MDSTPQQSSGQANSPQVKRGFTQHHFQSARLGPISKEFKSSAGFTLIELLLYIAMSAIMISIISIFLVSLLQSRVKNQTIAEIEQQGIQVMQLITQAVRNAEGINSPNPGLNSSALSVDVIDSSKDPTIFDLSLDVIQIIEGSDSAIPLTADRVIATDLNFQNLSRVDTPGIIRIQFTLTHINPEGRNEYDYAKTFYGSASLK